MCVVVVLWLGRPSKKRNEIENRAKKGKEKERKCIYINYITLHNIISATLKNLTRRCTSHFSCSPMAPCFSLFWEGGSCLGVKNEIEECGRSNAPSQMTWRIMSWHPPWFNGWMRGLVSLLCLADSLSVPLTHETFTLSFGWWQDCVKPKFKT